MNQQDASQPLNRYKKQMIYHRDSLGRFARDVFQFGNLPTEIQVLILIKAAVSRRLSGQSFGEVYDALAPVSQPWRKCISAPWFHEQIRQQAYQKGELDILRI